MGKHHTTKNTHPERKNQHSFSSTNQPARRGKRTRGDNKKSIAKKAFEDMGYNPMETQIQMIQKYQEMLRTGKGWDGETPLTNQQRDQFGHQIVQINKDLMQYQTTKATAEVQEAPEKAANDSQEVLDDDRPLNSSELLATKRKMASRRLEDKIG